MFFKFNLTLLIVAVFCIVGIFGRSQQAVSCGLQGASCNTDAECCNNAVCHRYAKKCQVPIDAQSLQAQRDRLRHTDSRYSSQLSTSNVNTQNCKQHGSPCVSDSECCSNAVCHRFANRCQIRITAEMLQEQRGRLRHVDNQYH